MATWTKLIAVNRILRAGGENPVNTLASTSGDSLIAEALLDEVNLEQQLSGLACNEENITLTADASGEFPIGDTVLHVQQVNDGEGPIELFDKLVVQRAGKLYNASDNTFTFDVGQELRVRLVTGLAYEELPFAQQVSIADEAAQRYQMFTQGDSGTDRTLREIWLQSRMKARAQDMRSRRPGIFGRWGSQLPYRAAKDVRRPRRGSF